MKLVFATNNKHKLEEMRAILGGKVELLSLADIDCHDDIPETAETLEGNALIKARHIYEKYSLACFADDTGLEVDALGGAPGVYSARYAGENNDSEANMQKLLANLDGKSDRRAQFRTVIALIIDGEERLFDGIVRGTIATERKGGAGFGYDPVFYLPQLKKTYAQLTADEKAAVSHRGKALEVFDGKLREYLANKE